MSSSCQPIGKGRTQKFDFPLPLSWSLKIEAATSVRNSKKKTRRQGIRGWYPGGGQQCKAFHVGQGGNVPLSWHRFVHTETQMHAFLHYIHFFFNFKHVAKNIISTVIQS